MRWHLSLLAVLGLPLALAACGGSGGQVAAGGSYARDYPPPGPPGDPWGPYIREASGRFSVPEAWIRAVIRQESGGHAVLHGRPTTSFAGAMGLMQLMPATYAMLRDRYGLGSDPYDPHDNIMAGTGYIAELNARYGSPGFLAAYDAGPHRLDQYLAGGGALPNETVNYLASVAPSLGGPMTGPLAAYADGGGAPVQVYAARAPMNAGGAGGCMRDPDAAYDPDHPCDALAAPGDAPGAPVQVAEAAPTARNVVLWGDASPPAPPPQAPVRAAPASAYPMRARRSSPFALIASAQASTVPITAGAALWGVQVGAFADAALARETAQQARALAPDVLAPAHTALGQVTPPGGVTLFRARLVGITHPAADTACQELGVRHFPCLMVPPGG